MLNAIFVFFSFFFFLGEAEGRTLCMEIRSLNAEDLTWKVIKAALIDFFFIATNKQMNVWSVKGITPRDKNTEDFHPHVHFPSQLPPLQLTDYTVINLTSCFSAKKSSD